MSKRDTITVRASRVDQILENEEFERAFNTYRDKVITDMERLKLDGTNNAEAAQLVSKLQVALGFKAELVRVLLTKDLANKRDDRQDVEEPYDPTQLKD